jgi:3-deoxy-D-manno-octulosonate 8-phosphate phosphatase (KDO 8-P phosphatase)
MKKIKAFFTDVDGVLTDGSINIGKDGELFKTFNVKDGAAIKELLEKDIIVAFITGRSSEIVELRAKELGVTLVYQNIEHKLKVYEKLKKEISSKLHEDVHDNVIVYVGDDTADNDILQKTESFCPSDATDETKKCAKHILQSRGGQGCIREIVDDLKKNDLL